MAATAGQWTAHTDDPFMRLSSPVRLGFAMYIMMSEVFSPLITYALYGGDSALLIPRFGLEFIYNSMILAPLFLWPRVVGLFHPLAFPTFYELARIITKDPTSILAPFGFLSGEPIAVLSHPALPGFDANQLVQARMLLSGYEILGLVCYYAGYSIFRFNFQPRPVATATSMVSLKSLAIVGTVFAGVVLFLGSQGGFAQHLSVLSMGRQDAMKDFGPIVVLFNFSPLAMFVWAAARPDQIGKPLFIAGLLLAAAVPFLVTGSRSASIVTIILIMILWIYHYRRVPVLVVIIMVPVTFLVLGYLQIVRSSAWSTGQVDFSAGNMAITDLFEETQRQMLARTSVQGGTPVVIRGPETTGLLLGETYLSAILFWVPRPLWEGKPRGVGVYYVNTILAPGARYSVPVGPIAEAYWNFHVPGIIVVMVMWGAFHRWLAAQFLASRGPFFLVFYILTLALAEPCTDNVVDYLQFIALLPVLKVIYTYGSRSMPFVARPA